MESGRVASENSALTNILQSRKYFLVYVGLVFNVLVHAKPYLMSDTVEDLLKVAGPFMEYCIYIIGTYGVVNVARKFSRENKFSVEVSSGSTEQSQHEKSEAL